MNVFTTKWEKSCSDLRCSTSLIVLEKRESFYIPCLESCFGALDRGEMLDRSVVLHRSSLRAICPMFSPFSFKGAQFALAPLPWFSLSCCGIYGLGSDSVSWLVSFNLSLLHAPELYWTSFSFFNLLYSLCHLVLSLVVMEVDIWRESSLELFGGKY